MSVSPRSDSDEVDRISEWKRRDEERRRELEARRRREQEEELRRLREQEKEEKERRRERAEHGEAERGGSSGEELREDDEPVKKRGRKGRGRGPPSSSDSEPEADLEREVGARVAALTHVALVSVLGMQQQGALVQPHGSWPCRPGGDRGVSAGMLPGALGRLLKPAPLSLTLCAFSVLSGGDLKASLKRDT